ncbi:transient-receptor-potential-like protein [Glandiceps talaboti]
MSAIMDADDVTIRTAFGVDSIETDIPSGHKTQYKFIELVESGNTDEVKEFLQGNRNLEIDSVICIKSIPYTALQVAAENDNFVMVKFLLDSGATALRHPGNSLGEHISDNDPLSTHLARLHLYSALTSPSHIALTSDDPLITALELIGNLRRLMSDCLSGDPFIVRILNCESNYYYDN